MMNGVERASRSVGGRSLRRVICLAATATLAWHVADASASVRISGTPPTSVQVGQLYSFVPSATDSRGRTLSFSIKNKPGWASFSRTTGKLSGSPTSANVGQYSSILISATDGRSSASLPSFAINVLASATAGPTISGTPPTSVQVGQSYSFTPKTTDPSGAALSFSIANKPTWATFSIATGTLSGTPAAAGTFANITISVSDGTRTAALAAFTVTVVAASTAGGGSTGGTTADLCEGLVTGKQKMPYTAAARPAKGVPFTDPDFRTRIIRITDVQGDWGAITAVPVYPTVPTWNADESYMLLYVRGASQGNYALLDGRTYAFLKWLPIAPADVEQFDWDPNDPDILWFIKSKVLMRYHVSTGVSDSVYAFPASADWGDDPIYFSWDGSLFGLRYQSLNQAVAYRSGVGLSSTVPLASGGENSPEACPSGTCLFWARNNGGYVYDPTTMKPLRTMTMQNTIEHGDLGKDSQGNDYWAAVSFNEGPNGSSGALMVEWLKSGIIKTLIGDANGDPYPPNGILISAKAIKNPNWVALAATGNTALVPTYQDQEIILANVQSGQVCRAAHHRSRGENGPIGYWSQPNVTLSPRGTRVVFPSDWGSGSTVDTYVLELPSYVP
jgi:hypothetical protein